MTPSDHEEVVRLLHARQPGHERVHSAREFQPSFVRERRVGPENSTRARFRDGKS